jgi:hypothetical protein
MRTPVEEAGIAGARLSRQVRDALASIPDHALARVMRDIERLSRERRFLYEHEGEAEIIRLLPVPIPALPDQLAYVRAATLALHAALRRLPDAYFADAEVRALLRLPDREEAWLRRHWTARTRQQNTVIGRHDAVIDFASPDWKGSLGFLEPNMGGVGGLQLVPTAASILAETTMPALRARDHTLALETAQDPRALLIQELIDHLETTGRSGRTICLLEPKYAGTGPDEQAELSRYVRAHFGVEVLHADPSELSLHHGEVVLEGRVIDLAYRDYAVEDILEIEDEGVDVAPMERLFAENRIVSTIAAELDQKSCFEIFTEPSLAARHASIDEQRFFRRHVPWTRLVRDARTTLPDGTTGALLEHLRREREHLVLKPNRSYGGEGITLGPSTSQGDWEALLDRAVRADEQGERWVAQRLVPLPVMELPFFDEAGVLRREPFFVVYGFDASDYGLGILGRASQSRVVNVAQRGGIVVVVVGHPPGRLVL